MDERSKIPVSLPLDHPTIPYWQDPPSDIAKARTTNELPSRADFVIVGSGISGACIALNILEKQPQANVLMLEARTACGGATGRNGGHTKGASYRHFPHEHQSLGLDEATRIARLEYANMRATHDLARKHGIKCDSNPSRTVDIIYDAEQVKSMKDTTSFMNKNVHGGIEYYEVFAETEAQEKFLCPGALAAVEYDAGSIHSYNFCIGVLKLAISKGLNLQTQTPVKSIEADNTEQWTAVTGRGSISAPRMILATNAYTAHLVPDVFQSLIVPLRGQITSQRPGLNMPKPLSHTYTFSYTGGYEYMIPRPRGSAHEGDILIGGGWATLPDEGASEFSETDDTTLNPAVSKYLYSCTERYFGSYWGQDDPDGRIRKEWTGIMGTSADGVPFVGEVPNKSGLWASVSFNGHGMVLCLKSAEALVTMMLGDNNQKSHLDTWFPRSFRLTRERVEKLKLQKFEGRRNVKPPPELLEERTQVRL